MLPTAPPTILQQLFPWTDYSLAVGDNDFDPMVDTVFNGDNGMANLGDGMATVDMVPALAEDEDDQDVVLENMDDCRGASDDVEENEGDDGGGMEPTTTDNRTNISTGGHNSSATTLPLDSNQHKVSADESTVMEEIINPGGKTYKVRRKGLNPLALRIWSKEEQNGVIAD